MFSLAASFLCFFTSSESLRASASSDTALQVGGKNRKRIYVISPWEDGNRRKTNNYDGFEKKHCW